MSDDEKMNEVEEDEKEAGSPKRQCIEELRYASPLRLLGSRPPDPTASCDSQTVFPSYLQNLLTLDPLEFKLGKDGSEIRTQTFYVGNVWDNAMGGPSVLVRSCYLKMFEHVNGKVTGGDRTPTIVSGTAGIGKSFFGLYAARRWFDDGKLVILWYETLIFVFSKNKMKEGQKEIAVNKKSIWWMRVMFQDDDYLLLKKDTNAILVRDPGQTRVVSPVSTLGFQLYSVSSGNINFLRQLRKNSTPILSMLRHMDLFDSEELIAALLCGCFRDNKGTFENPDATFRRTMHSSL